MTRRVSDVKRDDPTWPAMPAQVEAALSRWAAEHPARCRLVAEPAPSGHSVYVAEVGAVTNQDDRDRGTAEVLVVQPHAQEPAATPAIMELLSELVTGHRLDGSAADLPGVSRDEILGACRLWVNPLGNPDGRSRMPTVCWTPEFGRDEKRFYCNGKERGGGAILDVRSKAMRLDEVDLDPRYPVGCRLEHCGGGLYADPRGWPGDLASNPTTLARLLRRLLPQRSITVAVEMHQSDIPDHCYLILADLEDPEMNQRTEALTAKVENAWRAAGYPVGPRVYARAPGFVRGIHQGSPGRPPVLCVEVGEGMGVPSPWMTPDRQKKAGLIALHAVLEAVVEETQGTRVVTRG